LRALQPTLTKPATRQNDFGGAFGGPFRIPHSYNGKDKTFFFVLYEGLRLSQPQPATISFVPDAAVLASSPASLKKALSAFPVPNGPDDVANGIAQFIGSWTNPSSIDSTSARLDQVINDKWKLFFRFSNTSSNSAARLDPPSINRIAADTLRTFTGGASGVFSNRLSNEFRLNYGSSEVKSRSVIDSFGGNTPVDLAQLMGFDAHSYPQLYLFFDPYSPGLFQSQSSGALKQWNLLDTTSISLGRHQLKFGVDYRRLASAAISASPFPGYVFYSQTDVQNNSASLFMQSQAPAYPLYMNFSAFAQDDWRVSQRLSLSLGFRWEVNPSPGVTQGLNPYTIQGSGAATWTLAPQGTPLWQTTWYNFAPRLGVAYVLRTAPGWETVLRGGGGVFFDTGQQRGSFSFGGPGFYAASGPLTPVSFPTDPSALTAPIVNPPLPPYDEVVGFSPHLQLPYALQWNGSVEQALGKSQALTVSSVGSHASRLLQTNRFSSPISSLLYVIQNGLTSDYDSLQIQFRRRLSRGLTAMGSYTWSHCLDYNSADYVHAQLGYRRGNCDFDVRHNFSAASSYDLPNVRLNQFLRAVLNHWGVDERFTARTAFPVTLNGNSHYDSATRQRVSDGLNLIPGQPIYIYGSQCAAVYNNGLGCPGGRAINPGAFTAAPSGTLGNAPRNFVGGFGIWQGDLAVRREFPIYENLKLQFRAEAFNIFNHANFGLINSRRGQRTFGQATATLAQSLGVLNPLYQTGGPRSMQFALKVVF